MDRPGAVSQLRAVVEAFITTHLATVEQWCVALSGGPDSLALTAVAAQLRPTAAVVVDHGLQSDSAAVAEALPTLDEPNLTEGQEHEVEVGQERWVRSRWQDLLKRSGLHFEGDYSSPDVA